MESLNQNAVTRNNNGGPTRIHQQLKANLEYKMLFADLATSMYHDGILQPYQCRGSLPIQGFDY